MPARQNLGVVPGAAAPQNRWHNTIVLRGSGLAALAAARGATNALVVAAQAAEHRMCGTRVRKPLAAARKR